METQDGNEINEASVEAALGSGPGEEQLTEVERITRRTDASGEKDEDYAVSLSNAFRPSALGLSFLADLGLDAAGFLVEVVSVGRLSSDDCVDQACGTYTRAVISLSPAGEKKADRTIWLRRPVVTEGGGYPSISFSPGVLLAKGIVNLRRAVPGLEGFELELVSRPWGDEAASKRYRLLTVALVNRRTDLKGSVDENSLFQAGIRISRSDGVHWIRPYPGRRPVDGAAANPLDEESINRLLYRGQQTYAIGHGCSADWDGEPLAGTHRVWSDVVPVYETPSITADLSLSDEAGNVRQLRVSMRKLAGLDLQDDGMGELEQLIEAYARWIDSLEQEREGAPQIAAESRRTAAALVERCRTCLNRIRDGIDLLREDGEIGEHARKAFRLANEAMLIAQLRSGTDVRTPIFSASTNVSWSHPIVDPDPSEVHPKRGYWRPFQIAFLLMSLRGICNPEHRDREVVDLIWFPTGGGKTEAYLGLTAFTILFNRLASRPCGGADVLMRYTLRLLTAQQFQRAALLFCSLESLRKREGSALGDKAFRLGLWVGSATTPNNRKDALVALGKLTRDASAENPFVLLRCPWCGARFGPIESEAQSRGRRTGGADRPSVLGYYRKGTGSAQTVVYRCPDASCPFGLPRLAGKDRDPLPVVVIDEDLIEAPPNLLIGTVDKFAMLAWKPELRRFFGIDATGDHHLAPPTLVIQDELHMISGPLGTMVGAYETVIDRLCREHGLGRVGPKIVASTATISRAHEQIRHLYAREEVLLFPPSGLEAGDSFFAREDRDESGRPRPGRLYLGVLAPGHASLQTTQARVYATLMQGAAMMEADEGARDPWWTLLCFFNSLRELGGAATLFVSDARDYLRVILDRYGIPYGTIRSPFATELTSRIRGDDIPKELSRLEIPYRDPQAGGGAISERAVDVCLASNIIEVGVDIPRLSLMTIVGQPKSTSQYIQVSSRVGRDPQKPSLVVTLYGPSKPRDRSHFERFRGYHQRLYAQVEPTSVTPFSLPAVERALHGVTLAAVRQLGEIGTVGASPDPFPLADGSLLRGLVEDMIRTRVKFVAPDAEDAVMTRLAQRLAQWRTWNPSEYGSFGHVPEDPPLMHPAGSSMPAGWNGHSWPTMSSLRDVDAGCEADVTQHFNIVEDEQL